MPPNSCMEILLLTGRKHPSSEGHGSLSFQYPFEMLLNQKHTGIVSAYANNPDKERRGWVWCGLVTGFIP